MFKAYYFRL